MPLMALHPVSDRPRTAAVARIVIGRRVRMKVLSGALAPWGKGPTPPYFDRIFITPHPP
jgi:hypothetical protein